MNEDKSIIIVCVRAACGQKLKVPTNKGDLKLTCPRCHATWDWEPEKGVVDVISIRFGCSINGREFEVYFAKEGNDSKYRICKTLKVSKSKRKTSADLAKTATSKNIDVHVIGSSSIPIDSFDLTSWRCPYCHFSRNDEFPFDFIHCSECQRSICGKRSFTRSDGNRWFSCYPKCGCSGLISVECIESLSGTKIELSDTSVEQSGSATVRNRAPQSTSSLDKNQPGVLARKATDLDIRK